MSEQKQIRDENGKWLDTSVFRQPALKFIKDGYYISHPEGSQEWFDYWYEERKRCLEGYSVGGEKITGDHYFYLNYCPIRKAKFKKGSKVGKKITSFPDFWDGDYNYFWCREISRNGLKMASENPEEFEDLTVVEKGPESTKLFKKLKLYVKIKPEFLLGGYDFIVGKSRRRGYSYKAASIAACNYFHRPNSYTMFVAYEKKYLYPKGLFSMAKDFINFINDNTAWSMPSDEIDRQDHIKSSYVEYKDGTKRIGGFKSEIQALTANDNSDVTRGKDAYDVFVEESGAFGSPGLLKQLKTATYDVVRAGAIKTGMLTFFGTSGDMESGTADYADMHLRPKANDLLPFCNTWDEKSEETLCGFFHPINWNTEGFYDEQGNSDIESAKEYELKERKKLIDSGATSVEMQSRMQERPLGPKEAFGAVSINNFPIIELNGQLQKVISNNWQNTKGTPVSLSYDKDSVIATPILDGKANPITSYLNIPLDKRGHPVIYEYPVDNPPKGLYKIGYDPIRQDEGSSLAAIIVYKGTHVGSYNNNIVVAEYIGRKEVPEDIDQIAEQLAILYNTTIMHENEVPGVRNYFRRIKKLGLLAMQPDMVISKNIKKSKVSRIYGCHMTPQLKAAGERYIKEWLLKIQDYDEFGNPIRGIDKIYSRRLLEELINYNKDGNFDLISSLIMALFQVQEEELNTEYGSEEETTEEQKFNNFYEHLNRSYA